MKIACVEMQTREAKVNETRDTTNIQRTPKIFGEHPYEVSDQDIGKYKEYYSPPGNCNLAGMANLYLYV